MESLSIFETFNEVVCGVAALLYNHVRKRKGINTRGVVVAQGCALDLMHAHRSNSEDNFGLFTSQFHVILKVVHYIFRTELENSSTVSFSVFTR